MASQKLNPVHQLKRAVNLQRRIRKGVAKKLSVTKDYRFNVDSPRKRIVPEKKVIVEGWIIPRKVGSFNLRVRNNDKFYPVKTNIRRLDVAKSHPDIPKEAALYSGFRAEFEFEDGYIVLEVDRGKGYKKLYQKRIRFGVERLPADLYNKELSNNYPEHLNLLENRRKLYYEDSLPTHYVRHDKDPRLMALYLPQFHPFPENDEAWGKGFTEWSNVTTGLSRFVGHQQPILPRDLGFYDLRLESNILAQIELAKKYGLYGFCFYYYWFSGHKLMEAPLQSFLKHQEWDFNLAICWANENWTKRWDGRDDDIIIAQEYLEEDPLNFIKDVEPILLDERYVREAGKPILMVYRASELRNPAHYAEVWRKYFREQHQTELQLISVISFEDQDPREYGFDAALDFAPLSAFFKNKCFPKTQFPFIDVNQKMLDVNFSGIVADYRSIALNEKLDRAFDFPTYACLTPSWDNEARKKGKGFVFQNSDPDVYARWLSRLLNQEAAKQDAPLVFVNAWNEWAEGAMLEPSVHLGHAVLNRTAEALAAVSQNQDNARSFPAYGLSRQPAKQLAVVVHLYYTDLWPAMRDQLAHIDEPFDLFVTLNERCKDFQPQLDNQHTQVHTYTIPNRGRDVLPFLFVARRLRAAGYSYVLKLHSKKSKHRQDGSSWFGEVVESLLPDKKTVGRVIEQLADTKTGAIGPAHHLVSLKRHMGSNRLILADLLDRAYGRAVSKKVLDQPELYPYFGGTMFWARLDMLEAILNLYLMPDDFQSEHGQVDGTTAHALERMFGIVAKVENRHLYQVSAAGIKRVAERPYNEKYKHAP